MDNKTTISIFCKSIKCVADFQEVLTRNGFYLPKASSTLVTEDYLTKVANNQIWCLMYNDIRLILCPLPPTKEILLQKLMTYSESKNQ